ncbi:MAG: hypothetical protein EXX96DRAFT_126202 [Benjaminiella poitrasii]|nr:MAG: hypothetical protein EXX96DRAFT_126202 [Benjaminiella poitrasii]
MEGSSTGIRPDFQRKKEGLIKEAIAAVDQLVINVNTLNHHLEALAAIGYQFKQTAHLWSTFHDSINAEDDEEAITLAEDEKDSLGFSLGSLEVEDLVDEVDIIFNSRMLSS